MALLVALLLALVAVLVAALVIAVVVAVLVAVVSAMALGPVRKMVVPKRTETTPIASLRRPNRWA